MSATILQRVVVRMLHDPELRAAVYADPERALSGLELDADERAQLVQGDARAWAVDEHRADRVLTALLEEHPVATLALLEEGLPLERLRRFFQSAFFHDAIMARRSLAPAFGDYLGSLSRSPRARSLIALEAGIAALRRSVVTAPVTGPRLVRSPRHLPLELAAGTLAAWDRVRKTLGPKPAEAILGTRRPRLAAVDPRAREHVLLEMQDAPMAGFVGESLVRLLTEAAIPRSRDALLAVITAEGADANEAAEILDELVADGLLVAV